MSIRTDIRQLITSWLFGEILIWHIDVHASSNHAFSVGKSKQVRNADGALEDKDSEDEDGMYWSQPHPRANLISFSGECFEYITIPDDNVDNCSTLMGAARSNSIFRPCMVICFKYDMGIFLVLTLYGEELENRLFIRVGQIARPARQMTSAN